MLFICPPADGLALHLCGGLALLVWFSWLLAAPGHWLLHIQLTRSWRFTQVARLIVISLRTSSAYFFSLVIANDLSVGGTRPLFWIPTGNALARTGSSFSISSDRDSFSQFRLGWFVGFAHLLFDRHFGLAWAKICWQGFRTLSAGTSQQLFRLKIVLRIHFETLTWTLLGEVVDWFSVWSFLNGSLLITDIVIIFIRDW